MAFTLYSRHLLPFYQSDSYWIVMLNVWFFASQVNSYFYWSQSQLWSIQTDTRSLLFSACFILVFDFTHPIRHFPIFFFKGSHKCLQNERNIYKQLLVTEQQMPQTECLNYFWIGFASLGFWLFILLSSLTFSTYILEPVFARMKETVTGQHQWGVFYTHKKLIRWKNIKTNLEHFLFLTWINYWCKICQLKRTADFQF